MLVLMGSGCSVDSYRSDLVVVLLLLPDAETDAELPLAEAEQAEEEEYCESMDEASSTSNPTASVIRGCWPRLPSLPRLLLPMLPAPPPALRGMKVPPAVASGKKSMDRFRAVWEGRDGVEAEAARR